MTSEEILNRQGEIEQRKAEIEAALNGGKVSKETKQAVKKARKGRK